MKTFKQYLKESPKLKPLKYRTFSHPPTKTVAKVRVHKKEGVAWIDSLSTPEPYRGQGGAHHVMKQVNDYLDKNGLSGHLSSVPLDKKTDEKKLAAFYKKHGYKGKTYMVREPKK